MAANSVNLAFGAFETGSSSSGGQQDNHLVIPVTSASRSGQQHKRTVVSVTSPIHVGSGQFEFMSSSVEGASSENHSKLGGFGEFLHIGCVPENRDYESDISRTGSGISGTAICYGPSARGITQNLIESINHGPSARGITQNLIESVHGTRTPRSSSGAVTQNLIESINFEARTSYSPSIVHENQNLLGVGDIGSSFGCQNTCTPETHIVSSGFKIVSPDHHIDGFPANYFGSSESENISSSVYCQKYIASGSCEIYYGSGSIRISPSHVMQQNQDTNSFNISAISENNSKLHNFQTSSLTGQQNNVSIVNNTNRIQFEVGSNQHGSSHASRQNICPRRGRPQTHSGLNHRGAGSSTRGLCQNRSGINRNEAGPFVRGIQSTHSHQDLRTSTIHSAVGHVVAEPVPTRQPLRVNDHFAGKKRLKNKMAEIEDWTEDEIAIVEQAIKIPCTLTKPAWLSWISGFLKTKSAFDVAVYLKYFRTERDAKRIKVDHNVTSTGNNRQENVSGPSPSSSRLAGSFGPPAQDSTSRNQAMDGDIRQLLQPASAVFPPLPVIMEETTNAAPLDFGTNEEPVNSVYSPTFDVDLLDLSFLQSGNLDDLSHLSFPPEMPPGRTREP